MSWSVTLDDPAVSFTSWFETITEFTPAFPCWIAPPQVLAPATAAITGSGVTKPETDAKASVAFSGLGTAVVRTKAAAVIGSDLPASKCVPALKASADVGITGSGIARIRDTGTTPLPYSLPFGVGGVIHDGGDPDINAPAVVVITGSSAAVVALAARGFVSYDTRSTKAAVATDAPGEVAIDGSGGTGHPALLPFTLPAIL